VEDDIGPIRDQLSANLLLQITGHGIDGNPLWLMSPAATTSCRVTV